ncbi:MAG: alpha-L-fucosidase [Caldilineaceae bacterium]|nr:alpha-L-fucosidase [Caldilineaceae bacterium]
MAADLRQIAQRIAAGPFAATWDSLEGYTTPNWYQDAKFGIFIHWGVYAVPAFGNEWYPRNMYLPGTKEYEHHRATYGPQDEFGYKDFIPHFTAEHFDAEEWVRLFAEAGARFVVPVAEHHDGFQMYASDLSHWNAAEMGPKRDVVGELAAATRAAGMVFGVSSHRAEHWWYMGGGRTFDSDVQDPAFADFYGPAHGDRPRDNYVENSPSADYLEDWLRRTCELVDKYQPQLIWFDWWIMNLAFKPYLKQFAAHYYNSGAAWGKGVAINHKFDAFPTGVAVFDIERGQVKDLRGIFWQNDTSVSKNSWGYIDDHDYKQPVDIVQDLVDVVSKNGALLLNIGPRADGTIPQTEQEMLRAIGRWLAANGEAIYGTRPWHIYGEGPTQVQEGAFTDTRRAAFTSQDIRFTAKEGAIYAHVLRPPEDGTIAIRSLGQRSPHRLAQITAMRVLGRDAQVTWRHGEDALHVQIHGQVDGEFPIVLKIA